MTLRVLLNIPIPSMMAYETPLYEAPCLVDVKQPAEREIELAPSGRLII
jgi:hypothetical protein